MIKVAALNVQPQSHSEICQLETLESLTSYTWGNLSNVSPPQVTLQKYSCDKAQLNAANVYAMYMQL